MYCPLEVSESTHAFMLTHFVLADGVSLDCSVIYLGALRLRYSSSVTLHDSALDDIFSLFHRNDMSLSPETPISQRTLERVDVLERLKS